jgi:hypothetical protein
MLQLPNFLIYAELGLHQVLKMYVPYPLRMLTLFTLLYVENYTGPVMFYSAHLYVL